MKKRILVVDDEQGFLDLYTYLLEPMGFDVDCVRNGKEAVQKIVDKSFDLVLMDVHMPDVDGLKATRRIRAIETERGGIRTRIIAPTANVMTEDHESCLAAGMDSFLVKPLDRERLAEALSGKVAAKAA